MEMRKYLVTIHKDGHITADEYEEPKGFVYCSGDAPSVLDAYNRALIDVIAVLEADKARCDANCKKIDNSGNVTDTHTHSEYWAGRSVECNLLKTGIQKLFRKF